MATAGARGGRGPYRRLCHVRRRIWMARRGVGAMGAKHRVGSRNTSSGESIGRCSGSGVIRTASFVSSGAGWSCRQC